jgi:sugar phosphate isomerase/epimerase
MRASQVGIHSTSEQIEGAAACIAENGLKVSMVTGDFDTVYNNDNGPSSLTNITPYLELAQQLGAPRIRVALKKESDIANAQLAADEAAERNIELVHQCHTLSLFETVDSIEGTLKAIGRPNFGLVYEPANLEICNQDYGLSTLERLSEWIFNVYLQNQILKPEGLVTLPTRCNGDVSFDLISIHTSGGVNYDKVFSGLKSIGYEGSVTVHQSAQPGETPEDSAKGTAGFLRELIN